MSSALFGDGWNSTNLFMLVLDVGLFGTGTCLVGLVWCTNFIIDHPGWLIVVCLLLCLVARAVNEGENLTSSPLSSDEPPPEPSPIPARVPDWLVCCKRKSSPQSEPGPLARRYTDPEPCPTPHRYERTRFGPSNYRNDQVRVPKSKLGATVPIYAAFATPATSLLRHSSWSQQPCPRPSTPANQHSVGLGERVRPGLPLITLGDPTPTPISTTALLALGSPMVVGGLGPDVPSRPALPPALVSSYVHRPRVLIAEETMGCADLGPLLLPVQDDDMRGPGMDDMGVF